LRKSCRSVTLHPTPSLLTVALQVGCTECARFGCQVSRYRRYLAHISYTRVIGTQHSGFPTCRQQLTTDATRRDSLRYSVRSLPTCGTMREIIYHWNTLDLARTCCELKLNPERSFLTSRACVRRRSYLKFYSGERKWIFHSVKQRDGRSTHLSFISVTEHNQFPSRKRSWKKKLAFFSKRTDMCRTFVYFSYVPIYTASIENSSRYVYYKFYIEIRPK